MKVVIEIPDFIYITLIETGKYGYYRFDAKRAIKNGTLLPEPKSPCDVCKYNPPSSGDGKPCTMCPAEREKT